MRLDLPDGQWAELRDRLLYLQAKPVRAAYLAALADDEDKSSAGAVELDMALVRAYVSAWHVLDLDGHAVPIDTPELAPDDIIQAVAVAANKKWNATPDPKGSAATSASTSPEP